jgi:hypothetical protein
MSLKYIKILIKLIMIQIFILGHSLNAGQIFNINISNYGGIDPTIVDAVVSELETEVMTNLPNTDQSEFFQSMANASTMAGKDLANDPINHIDYAMVFLGVGAGVDLNKKEYDDIKDSDGDIDLNKAPGIGVQLGFGIGTHGKFLPKKHFNGEKWSFFINYFPYNFVKDDISLKIRTGGLHMRYRLLSGYDLVRWKMLRLEPVFLTFGYEFNKLKGRFSEVLSETYASGGVTGTFSGTGVIALDVMTHSFPVSISSGITLLYILTLYGGLGVDINQGSAEGGGSLEDTTLTISQGGSNATGTASLDLGSKNNPTLMLSRAFLGAQINLWNFKIFAQAQKTFDRNLYGAQVGLKYFF